MWLMTAFATKGGWKYLMKYIVEVKIPSMEPDTC